MVRIGSQLVKSGKPEYQTMIEGLQDADDEDIKLAALYALKDIAMIKRSELLQTCMTAQTSDNIHSKIVYILGDFDTKNQSTN